MFSNINTITNRAVRTLFAPDTTASSTPVAAPVLAPTTRRVGGFRGVRPVRGAVPTPALAPAPEAVAMTTHIFRVTRETGTNAIILSDDFRNAKVWGILTLNVRHDEKGVYIAIDAPKTVSRDEVLVALQTLLDKVYGYDDETDETYSVELEGEEENLRAISQIMVSNAVEQYNGGEEQQLPQFVRQFVCELVSQQYAGEPTCHLKEDHFNFKIVEDEPMGIFDDNGDDVHRTLLAGTWF